MEREINEIIQGVHIHRRSSTKREELVQFEEKGKLPAKSIDNDDVCPICQEEIKNCKEPLTHCKYAFGRLFLLYEFCSSIFCFLFSLLAFIR